MPPPATVGDALFQRVTSDAGIAALIGTRFYPQLPTQEPDGNYAVYQRTSGGDLTTLAGRSGLQRYSVRIDVIATTQKEAEAILNAITVRLAGDGGATPPWSDRGNGVQACFPEGDVNDDTLDDGRRWPGQTFGIWFKPQV